MTQPDARTVIAKRLCCGPEACWAPEECVALRPERDDQSGRIIPGIICEADDILAALRAAGMAVVPVEPTWEMAMVAVDAYNEGGEDEIASRISAIGMKQAYRAMLAASARGGE